MFREVFLRFCPRATLRRTHSILKDGSQLSRLFVVFPLAIRHLYILQEAAKADFIPAQIELRALPLVLSKYPQGSRKIRNQR